MDTKDTYFTQAYKTGYIHTCENRTTGETEVQATLGSLSWKCATVAGAKRKITREEKQRATGSGDWSQDVSRDGATLDRLIEGLARAVLNWRNWHDRDTENQEMWDKYATNKKELRRLIVQAGDFATVSKTSLLILIRLNESLRAVPLHTFGGYVRLESLLK